MSTIEPKKKDEFPSEIIGQRIRDLRKMNGFTIEELAKKIELSQSMVSQIERGQANPSLDTLWKLSTVLEVPVFSFFETIDQNPVRITRHREQKIMKMLHENVTYRILSPNSENKIGFLVLNVEHTEVKDMPLLAHKGEECGYVIQGELIVNIDGQSYRLEAGDSIYFDSTLPHSFYNPNIITAVAVWAMTPPTK